MFEEDFLDYIEDAYDYDDILYIIGKDKRWLLRQISEELRQHRRDFFDGDESYSEVVDE